MTPQVFTPSEQCTLYSSKVNYAIKCFKFTNVRYIPILFMCEWLWFGILESYAIKQFMCLTSMQLDEVVCNFKHYHQVYSSYLQFAYAQKIQPQHLQISLSDYRKTCMYVKLDSQSLINVYKSLEKYFNKLLQLFEK